MASPDIARKLPDVPGANIAFQPPPFDPSQGAPGPSDAHRAAADAYTQAASAIDAAHAAGDATRTSTASAIPSEAQRAVTPTGVIPPAADKGTSYTEPAQPVSDLENATRSQS